MSNTDDGEQAEVIIDQNLVADRLEVIVRSRKKICNRNDPSEVVRRGPQNLDSKVSEERAACLKMHSPDNSSPTSGIPELIR